MANLDLSRDRRVAFSISLETHLSSDSWGYIRDGFKKGNVGFEGMAIGFGGAGLRDPKKRELLAAAAIGAKGVAFLAKLAADWADTHAQQAKAEEEAQAAAEAQKRERQERIAAEQKPLQRALERAGHEHERRVRDGSFLKEYRDTPIREREYIGRNTA